MDEGEKYVLVPTTRRKQMRRERITDVTLSMALADNMLTVGKDDLSNLQISYAAQHALPKATGKVMAPVPLAVPLASAAASSNETPSRKEEPDDLMGMGLTVLDLNDVVEEEADAEAAATVGRKRKGAGAASASKKRKGADGGGIDDSQAPANNVLVLKIHKEKAGKKAAGGGGGGGGDGGEPGTSIVLAGKKGSWGPAQT